MYREDGGKNIHLWNQISVAARKVPNSTSDVHYKGEHKEVWFKGLERSTSLRDTRYMHTIHTLMDLHTMMGERGGEKI